MGPEVMSDGGGTEGRVDHGSGGGAGAGLVRAWSDWEERSMKIAYLLGRRRSDTANRCFMPRPRVQYAKSKDVQVGCLLRSGTPLQWRPIYMPRIKRSIGVAR